MTVFDLAESYLEKIKELVQSVFSAPPWNEEWDDDQLDNYIRELIEVRQPIFLMTERTQPAYEFYKHIGFTELPDLTAFVKEI